MSIKAFPLNQQEYSYNAQDVMKYYAGRNSGVFETGDNLKVSANGGLELRINTGMGWLAKDYVASVAFWNESVEYLMVEAGHDTYNRIDLVVVSWNFIQQEQNPKLIIRKGTPASSPAVPSLINDSSTIEIALARINVAKGAITLSNSDIVDLRGNDTYCPMVYDEQTIREAFRKCVGYADGVNKISDFPNVTPASSDKILIEQRGEGKSASIADAVNTCSLTYEQIMASTDLTKKVASAGALKTLGDNSYCEHVVTENSGEYWRFASGLQICLLNKSLGSPTFNSWGSVYSYIIPSTAFPAPFVSLPYVAVIASSDVASWGGVHGDLKASTTSWNNMLMIRATPANYQLSVNLIAIGIWK